MTEGFRATDGSACNRLHDGWPNLVDPDPFRPRWLVQALREERKLHRQLENAVRNGNRHAAASLRRRYVRSYHAKIAAAWAAVRREARHHDGVPDPVDALYLARLPKAADPLGEVLAPALDLRSPCDEPVRVSARPKRKGGYRPISSPGVERYARMRLAKRAMEPFVSAELRPSSTASPPVARNGRAASGRTVSGTTADGILASPRCRSCSSSAIAKGGTVMAGS